MTLTGRNLIWGSETASGSHAFQATDPTTGTSVGPFFFEATPDEVDRAAEAAADAGPDPAFQSAEQRTALLRAIADEIQQDASAIIARAMLETGLPQPRLEGECARTTAQARLFADVVAEGSWVEARIDRGDPQRRPVPKPDLRRMLVALGPVAVFGASNFPLAFSVAGGDTISALAAGCPVVVKAHPAHPGTSELVGRAMLRALQSMSLPAGLFSLVHGVSEQVGRRLVTHPLIRAVGFTGSLGGGRALFDAAGKRPEPIPVYAEMGSVNPVFLLPEALQCRAPEIAQGLFQSFTLGVGQFCTKPGLIFACEGPDLNRLLLDLAELVKSAAPGTMLHSGISRRFRRASGLLRREGGIRVAAAASSSVLLRKSQAAPWVAETSLADFERNPGLAEEIFGPVTLLIRCPDHKGLIRAAGLLAGQLTGTIHAEPGELERYPELLEQLRRRVGRLVLNGFPTGVEVGHAMHHGGPYPATTDSRVTSVGTAAIQRFARPVCYQNFPVSLLPAELRDHNERGIWRLVDGTVTRS